MKATTSCRWAITLSLISIFAAVVGATPAHSQSTAAPGSMGSRSGGSQETPIPPAKPRGSHPDGAMRSMRPSDIPGQTLVPSERTRALEERLRSGQIERPIAQDHVSDWLEQLHSGSAEGSTGETAPGQSVQGNMSD
jgi:hypothetical protein